MPVRLIAAVLILSLLSPPAAPYPVPSADADRAVLILDAGHGGEDGGAVAPDGTEEAPLNLEIVLEMRRILALFGITPVLTRESADIAYPDSLRSIRERKVWDQRRRAELVRETPSAVLVSVHQNLYPAPGPHGPQALWAPTEGSRELAERLETLFRETLSPDGAREACRIAPEIYLMNTVTCPAVLVECGFLSNPADLADLRDPRYRTAFAAVLTAGVLTWLDASEFGGTYERQDSVLLY